MNKWLRELKSLTTNQEVINYYTKMIDEEELDDYYEICAEIGTPKKIYDQEKNNFDIEGNKVTSAGKKTLSFFRKIFFGIIIFILFIALIVSGSIVIASAFSLVIVPFSSKDIIEKIAQVLFMLLSLPMSWSLTWLINETLKSTKALYNAKPVEFNTRKLKFMLPIFIICGLGVTANGFWIYNIQSKEIIPTTTYTQKFTKNLEFVSNDATVHVVNSDVNKVVYKAKGKGNYWNMIEFSI